MDPTKLNATPLISIDAVALDTETTGLDTKSARIIQIGGVALRHRQIVEDAVFDQLVDPGEPIPPLSTAVHGIEDAAVAGKPSFPEVVGALDAFVGDRIVIGHSVGFDVAVLASEHERAGLAFKRPRTLDTALLAQIALPKLPDHSLDMLAQRLGVEIVGRHSALGDARMTAEIFLALIPHLRRRNIRTLAEAEAACRGLTRIIDEQYKAGWAEPVAGPDATLSERALARLDAYPYRHRVAEIMSKPPIGTAPATSIGEALSMLASKRISALIVSDDPAFAAAKSGIVTERDLLRRLARDGAGAFSTPVGEIASKPLECIFEDAFLYRAIGRMTRLNVRHLAVQNEQRRIVGILTQRDLLRLRSTDAISLGDEIDTARDTSELGIAWAKIPSVAAGLVAEGTKGREIAAIVSRELCAMTRRAAELAEARMQKDGLGGAPVPYALLVLGSGGRGESMLAPDQDNAIVHADTADPEATDRWFEEFGKRVAATLNAVGIPYCKGGIMASNPAWRHSISDWEKQVSAWIRRSKPEDLLNVDIFFDFRAVHGDASLAQRLWNFAYAQARGQVNFTQALALQIGDYRPPLTLFGNLRTESGRVDLKKGGLFPIVAIARALSIRHHVLERSTLGRLQGLAALEIGSQTDLIRLMEAQASLMDIVVRQQLGDIESGLPPTNTVDPKAFGDTEAARLREVLSGLSHIGETARDLMS